MKFHRFQKQTALTLSLLCLFWAGYMMVPMGHHMMEHGKAADHSGQHSSAACAWICGSSVFSQTGTTFFEYEILPFLFTVSLLLTALRSTLPQNNLRDRAPPF